MPMKLIFAIVLTAVSGFSVSCRVDAPLDAETMKPSCERCPANFYHGYSSSCESCGYGVTHRDRFNLDTCPGGSCK